MSYAKPKKLLLPSFENNITSKSSTINFSVEKLNKLKNYTINNFSSAKSLDKVWLVAIKICEARNFTTKKIEYMSPMCT